MPNSDEFVITGSGSRHLNGESGTSNYTEMSPNEIAQDITELGILAAVEDQPYTYEELERLGRAMAEKGGNVRTGVRRLFESGLIRKLE